MPIKVNSSVAMGPNMTKLLLLNTSQKISMSRKVWKTLDPSEDNFRWPKLP